MSTVLIILIVLLLLGGGGGWYYGGPYIGGGLGSLRVMSHLCPDRRGVGHSVTRSRAEIFARAKRTFIVSPKSPI